MVTPSVLLEKLPPYRDEWVIIHPDQSVSTIINELIEAHKDFAGYYDNIALYFDADNIEDIAAQLYSFCKTYIRYREEKEVRQTSSLPTGILIRGYGDCKHYASFCAGVLDAITRLTGKKINWCYRFASYDLVKTTPHHVFIVIDDGTSEIWIDPTPGADKLTPTWQIDKKVKGRKMLERNIGSVINDPHELLMQFGNSGNSAMGKANLDLAPYTGPDNNLNWDGTNKYQNAFTPYLGLSWYRDLGGDRNLNKSEVAAQINSMIAHGPSPGHTVDGDFVEWVYNTNLRSWNFYYPGGVRPGFTAANILPATWPRMIISQDGRLTFDRDIKIDDWRNAEIHLLTAWAQALINQYDPSPYPLKPQHLKEFSQLLYGNVETRDLFTERRGQSIFVEVGKALEDTVNFLKDNVITIVGFIPRNAFLGLVGINGFGFATSLWKNIEAGKWDQISAIWDKIGGNPDKLLSTIKDGKDKNAILGQVQYGNVIGVEPVSTSAATLIVAAAPIVAALLAFLDKEGKAAEVLSATKSYLQTQYPDLDLTAYGFLDRKTGQYVQWESDPRYNENMGANNPGTLPPIPGQGNFLTDNPLMVAVASAAIGYLLVNKKGRKPNYVVPLGIGAGSYLLITKLLNKNGSGTTINKQEYLNNWVASQGESQELVNYFKDAFARMTQVEIGYMYDFIVNYVKKGIYPSPDSELYRKLAELDAKYHVLGT